MENMIKSIKGNVIHGIKKGRTLGFPTANIEVISDLVLEQGIYAGYVVVEGKKYQSALYYPGPARAGGENIIEAFILDFSGDLYSMEVMVELVKKIRDKKDFKSAEEATEQITKDVAEIKQCLLE